MKKLFRSIGITINVNIHSVDLLLGKVVVGTCKRPESMRASDWIDFWEKEFTVDGYRL